ncbi:MAG: hypothetical protein V5A47_02140, partial [Bacteroidales bacterium]
LETKKIRFLKEVLRIKNEHIIERLEQVLHQERKKSFGEEVNPMTMEEFDSLINKAEEDSQKERVYNAGGIFKDIDEWE